MTGPGPSEPRGSPPRFFVHLCVFVTLLGLMTWKLLEPRPVPESLRGELSGDWLFVLAKCFHAGAYAVLAVLAWTLPAPRLWRAALVVFLLLHGVGTEIGQTFVPNRTGKATDVLIDWAGVTIGIVSVTVWGRNHHRG